MFRGAVFRGAAVVLVLGVAAGLIPGRLAGATGSAAEPAEPRSTVGRVLLIGVPDLRWTDLDPDRTPALDAFVRRAAVGALAVKAAGLPTREPAGWLTVGAGNRMAGVALLGPPTAVLDRARTRNAAEPYGAQAGALGSALRAAGRSATAEGGPWPSVVAAPAAAPASGATADLTVVSDRRLYGTAGGARRRAAIALDQELAPLLASGGKARTVLLAGVSDGTTGGAALHVAAAAGPGFSPGALVSASTRRPPYVQLIDLAPTVLTALGIATPPSMAGTPWRSTASAAQHRTPSAMADLDVAARAGLRWAGVFATALVWAVLGLAALFTVSVSGCGHRRGRRAVAALGYWVAALPAASYLLQLLPWWRVAAAGPAVLLAIPSAMASLAAVADRRRRGGGPLVVTAITTGVLGADLASGTHLQLAALLGDSPLIAGRFAGFGNLASALFVSSGLLLLGLTCTPRRAVLPAAITGVSGLVLLGAPGFGADAGGLLATTPALGVLLLRLAGRTVRLRAAASLGLAAAGVLGAAAVADYARPEASQTHLGRFVGSLLHGGTGLTAPRRHLAAAAHSLISSPFNLAALLVAGLAVVVVRGGFRPQCRAVAAVPGMGGGLLAAAAAVTLGGLVNDSGVAVPGVAACLLVPLTLACAAEAVGGGHGNAGVDKLGSEVSDAAQHSAARASRPRPRLRGARAATGLARYQT